MNDNGQFSRLLDKINELGLDEKTIVTDSAGNAMTSCNPPASPPASPCSASPPDAGANMSGACACIISPMQPG